MVVVVNGKLWGIFWGLVEGNSFWKGFFNIKLRSFIKWLRLMLRRIEKIFKI